MKAVVAAFNQEKALVGAFSVITNLRMELFQALIFTIVFIPAGITMLVSRTSVITFSRKVIQQLGGCLGCGRGIQSDDGCVTPDAGVQVSRVLQF